MKFAVIAPVAAAVAALAGCQALGLSCTEMGCFGTLTVHLDRLPTDDAVISVDLGDGALPCGYPTETTEPLCQIVDDADGPALTVEVGMGQDPETIDVAVSEGGAASETVTLAVAWGDPWYPNGRACDHDGCRAGDADLSLD